MMYACQLDSFKKQGFVFIEAFRSPIQVQEIVANLERVIRETVPQMPPEHVFYEDKSKPETLKQIQNLHVHDPYFGALMESGPFRELAVSLLGTEVTAQNMQYFNKPPGVGLPTPAHQDGYYFKLEPCEALTIWMALEPVDHENGCVRYVPGSHLQPMRPHAATGTLGFSQGIIDFPNPLDAANELAFPAGPGDLLAHHALTIHRADGNHSPTRSRRALGLIYYGSNARQNVVAWQNYQDQLAATLAKSGKI